MNPSIPPGRPGSWDDFVADCRACTACPLHASRTQSVVWRGAVTAPLMFIGEGPGREEDLAGVPFVGRAGRLLDTLLVAQGFPPESFHIGNIVKCRPPENRVPTEEEAMACRSLLARQILFVRPKILVLLGATAFRYITGSREGISKARGTFTEKNGYLMMPTFHPAYILRNERDRILLWQDLLAVRREMERRGFLLPLPEVPTSPETRS